MTEQQIEVWRKEFEKIFSEFMENCYFCEESERYRGNAAYAMNIRYSGFIAAKRNQPVIELPNSDLIVFDSRSKERGFDSAIEYVAEILQELGYQFKVKE